LTPEAKVKAKVVATLKANEVYYFYPVMGGYGTSGVPDIVVCCNGRFLAIECKAGKNKPTMLQERNMQKIRDSGGIAIVVNEENLNTVQDVLSQLQEITNGKHE
jgi:Holliday junction resolvase